MSAFDTLLREIAELTDCNCHSEARIEIASFFFLATGNKGFKKMEQVFDWICREVEDRQGRDCHQLISQREELTTAMFTLADKLGYSSASQAFQQRL